MTFIRYELLTVSEAMKLEHLGFILHLIKVGENKDLYKIYAKEG
jgi:hypothetical protein